MATPRRFSPVARVRTAKACECAQLVALALWLGAAVMSGVVAAVVFPLMHDLAPVLGAYPAYSGDHAPLAAGRVAARVFLLADDAQFGAALVVLPTTIALAGFLGWNTRRPATVVRMLAIGAALLVLSYRVMVLAPRMDSNLRAYWDAAAAGRNGDAEIARAAFADDHPAASRVILATTTLVLVALIAGAWSVQGAVVRGAPTASQPGGSPG